VAVGDFNGDGIPDIAVPDETNSTVGLLMGNGDGSFQDPINYKVPAGVYDLVAGDFNGDGNLDLIVSNYTSALTVLLGNGDGTFQPPSQISIPGPLKLATADFNQDGNLDLAVTHGYLGNTVSVLLGNGDGTFQFFQDYAVGNLPVEVAAGDFNRDGWPDLAVANFSSSSISVLLNDGNWGMHPGAGAMRSRHTSGGFIGNLRLESGLTLTAWPNYAATSSTVSLASPAGLASVPPLPERIERLNTATDWQQRGFELVKSRPRENLLDDFWFDGVGVIRLPGPNSE